MATIGVSNPHVAKYVNTDGTVSYTDVTRLAKAVQFSAEISSGDGSNNLYADNGVAESDKSFEGGTMTKDLAGLWEGEAPARTVNSTDFLYAIRDELEERL